MGGTYAFLFAIVLFAQKKNSEFISEFFPVGHPVRSDEPMDVKQYIRELTKAFSFDGKYYTTSYFIERDCKNYFALFFMTTNLLGLEKAVDTLWELDKL